MSMPILMLLFCAALPAQSQQSFSGEYKGEQVTLKLQASGTQYSGTIDYQGGSFPLTARVSAAGLDGSFRAEGQQFPFTIRREGSALLLNTAGTTYRLQPVERSAANPLARSNISAPAASPSMPAQSSQGLVGTWRGSSGTMRFDAGGTGTANGESFRYQVEGNAITLAAGTGTVKLTYTLQGSSLRLAGPRGEMELTRVADSGGPGRVLPELAGKWCMISNFNATDGGARTSNTCFTLTADGRYEYYAETDSYGKYGGATSQSSDRGTWTATETTITARSARGTVTTYTLEKRNHPKNNDPMLLLDGQAFVTFYQKPRW